MTASQLPGGPKPDSAKSVKVLAAVLDATDCATNLEGQLRSEVTDAASAGELSGP
jgi:hypothetical protein